MALRVNGSERPAQAGLTVAALLAELELAPERVVVELNREITRREEYGRTPLRDGDAVEIVEIVGGG